MRTQFMFGLAAMLMVSGIANAIDDPNRVIGDDWDDNASYPGTFVEAYDTEFNPEWYSWPVTDGVVNLEYNDVTISWIDTNLSGRMYWKVPENYGGGPYSAAIDTTTITDDIYLIVRFKVNVSALANDGTFGLVMELSDSSYGDLTSTVLRVPITNGGDFATVVLNLSDTADTDPNTFQGQGGAVTWPVGSVVPDSLGFFAMQFGDFNDGTEVIETGDLLDLDCLVLTTDYTPYLPAAEGEGEGEGLPTAGGVGLGLLVGAIVLVRSRLR